VEREVALRGESSMPASFTFVLACLLVGFRYLKNNEMCTQCSSESPIGVLGFSQGFQDFVRQPPDGH
jgi:hypothetical protein